MPASTRLIVCALCCILGIGLGAGSHVQPTWYAWGFSLALITSGFKLQPRRYAALLAAGSLAAGFLHAAGWRAVTIPWKFDRELSFSGTVVAPPDRRASKTLLAVLPDGSSGPKILVTAGRYPAAAYGDRLRIAGAIERPKPFQDFDYPLYLEKDRVYGTMSQPKSLDITGHGAGNPLLGGLYRLRETVEGRVQASVPEPEAGFLNGIMLGSKRSVPTDLQEALQATGTSHIIAISGANITILLDIMLQGLPLYTLKRQFWAVAGIALFVCLLTGASASVVRGGLIACLGRWARLYSRKAWTLPLILAGMLLMLIDSPLLLVADPGFQLSFAAFAGLAWLGAPCARFLESRPPFSRWPEAVRGSLAETLAASVATAPVSLALFGQLSLLGLVVNPLILWLLPAVTFMGLALCAAGWIPPVVAALQFPLWLCLHAILAVISWFGRLDFGLIRWKPSWALSLALWATAALLLIAIRKRHPYAPT